MILGASVFSVMPIIRLTEDPSSNSEKPEEGVFLKEVQHANVDMEMHPKE